MSLRIARPHQEIGIQQIANNRSTALFWEMRLGKTMAAIRGLKKILPACSKVLVVAPIEAIWAWERETKMEMSTSVRLLGTAKERKALFMKESMKVVHPTTFFLVNYEGLKTLAAQIYYTEWDAIVLDESRRIANPKNMATKFLQGLPRHPKQVRLVLSGKPAPESPLEYFEQIKFIKGHFTGTTNYWMFRNAYFTELAPHEWVPKQGRLNELKEYIHSNGNFLTRKQAGLADVKVKEVRTVQLPKEIRNAYEKLKKDFLVEIKKKELAFTKWIPVQYMWLHQLSSGFLGERNLWNGKLNALYTLLEGELKEEPVVVWFKFNAPLYEVAAHLEKKRMRVEKITGEDQPAERFKSIDRFREGKTKILLIQIKCGKTAIDLSTCSTAIYFSTSHSLEERLQSEDRLVNPAKKDPNLYVDLVAENTVEEDILEVLKMKKGDSAFYESKMLINLLQKRSTLEPVNSFN